MSRVTEIKWNCDGKMVNQDGEELVVVTKEEYEGHVAANKHLKGYIYDSLVYRYQIARYKASEADATDMICQRNITRREAEAEARKNYNRDIMRFCQILDEVIGEHD